MQFSEGDLRQDPGALRTMASTPVTRRGLFGLQQRGLQLRPRRFLSGARLIEIFLGSEPLRHQRLKADTRGGGLLNQRSGALDAAATDWALYSCALIVRWVSMICASRVVSRAFASSSIA